MLIFRSVEEQSLEFVGFPDCTHEASKNRVLVDPFKGSRGLAWAVYLETPMWLLTQNNKTGHNQKRTPLESAGKASVMRTDSRALDPQYSRSVWYGDFCAGM